MSGQRRISEMASAYSVLKETVRPKFGKKPDLSSYRAVLQFLRGAGAQVILRAFSSGILGCSFKLPNGTLALCVNMALDDDQKLLVAAHEFAEAHLEEWIDPFRTYVCPYITEIIVNGRFDFTKRGRRLLYDPERDNLAIVFLISLIWHTTIEYDGWRFCGDIVNDAELNEDRRSKLRQIVEDRLHNIAVFRERLLPYHLRMSRLFQLGPGESWIPAEIEKKIAVRLLREIVAVASNYVKIDGIHDDKQVARSQTHWNNMVGPWQKLKGLLKKSDPAARCQSRHGEIIDAREELTRRQSRLDEIISAWEELKCLLKKNNPGA